MKTKNYLISLTIILSFFVIGFSASSSESPVYTLNPGLESGLTGEVQNCSPLTVTNGTVAAYPGCAITCNSGYTLSGSSCVVTPSSGGGGGSVVNYCTSVSYGNWGSCIGEFQFRQVLSQSPSGCTLTSAQQIAAQRTCVIDDSIVPSDDDEEEEDTPSDTTPPAESWIDVKAVMDAERGMVSRVNTQLTNRLNGRILLQVENNGQAWYVEPIAKTRHFMGRPHDAFDMMRRFGLGISEANFNRFQRSGVPSRFAGRILLRVEANGEAYYINPVDMKMHYLGRPHDAFRIMRELALGINNENIRQIAVGN